MKLSRFELLTECVCGNNVYINSLNVTPFGEPFEHLLAFEDVFDTLIIKVFCIPETLSRSSLCLKMCFDTISIEAFWVC